MSFNLFVHFSNKPEDMEPEDINQWFLIEQQEKYISRLAEQITITACQARCYFRLWAYLLVKQQSKLGKTVKLPLKELSLPDGFVSCTLQEAAALFYCDQDQGSDRSAGMMLDKLRDRGLIEKKFDGNSLCIQILYQLKPQPSPQPVEIDDFHHNDAVFVAEFLSNLYSWINNDTATVKLKIVNVLRRWVKEYPQGMRVLRRCDNSKPVGFYILYPTAQESERNFFLPPSKTLLLGSNLDIDPLQIAIPPDSDCCSVFIRSWKIDTPYKTQENVCRFLKDTQETLKQMQADFPNLCDLYVMIIHPVYSYESLALALGFERIGSDLTSPSYWMYKPINQFLDLDMEKALSKLDFATPSPDV